jgi:hypothetical protein
VAAVLENVPSGIILREIDMRHESVDAPSPVRPTHRGPVADVAPPRQQPALQSQQDLNQLREQYDTQRTIIMLGGITQDISALHAYLARLGELPVVASADVVSIESVKSAGHDLAQFEARLTVASSYGQPGQKAPADVDAALVRITR